MSCFGQDSPFLNPVPAVLTFLAKVGMCPVCFCQLDQFSRANGTNAHFCQNWGGVQRNMQGREGVNSNASPMRRGGGRAQVSSGGGAVGKGLGLRHTVFCFPLGKYGHPMYFLYIMYLIRGNSSSKTRITVCNAKVI